MELGLKLKWLNFGFDLHCESKTEHFATCLYKYTVTSPQIRSRGRCGGAVTNRTERQKRKPVDAWCVGAFQQRYAVLNWSCFICVLVKKKQHPFVFFLFSLFKFHSHEYVFVAGSPQ